MIQIRNILDEAYEQMFNDASYPSPIPELLSGLAAAIQDSHLTWRPTLSELVSLLPSNKDSNRIVLAGSAYGAAKAIRDDFPGPAILLFGAALNAIGSAPQVELNKNIDSAKKKLQNLNLHKDTDIKEVLKAANERANFDRVGVMLKQEFSNGLKKTGKYTDEQIAKVVTEISEIANNVRHKGLIDKFYWRVVESDLSLLDKNISTNESSTNISFLHQENSINVDESEIRKLIPYAQEGCAFTILSRMED